MMYATLVLLLPLEIAEIVIQVESAVVAAFVELVVKLNDTAFRPLFRKLFDWAFTGTPRHAIGCGAFSKSPSVSESSAERKIAFCNAYMGLLEYFKVTHTIQGPINKCLPAFLVTQSLMTPYLSFLLPPLVEQLRGSDNREEGSIGLTELCVVQTLTKSMNVDEGGPYSQPSPLDTACHRHLTFIF